MHHRLLVTCSTEHATTSQEARKYVYETLFAQGFCPAGRWGGIADWFVIGGRSSGLLSRLTWGKRLHEEIQAAEKEAGVEVEGVFYSDATMRASKVQTLDGRRGVIVTTLLLDGKIYHDVERSRPHHHYAHH
jgi:hypothetical protein